jgi:hypothetical protein
MRACTAAPADRRTLIRSVGPLVAGGTFVYHAWRTWYFGDWLPMPLRAKVLHKLTGEEGAVVSVAPVGYLDAFVDLHGAGLVVALGGLMLVAVSRSGPQRARFLALAGTLAGLLWYVDYVGDWMFGWRFLVPLVAPLALIVAGGVGHLASSRTWAGWGAAAGVAAVVWPAAHAFRSHYTQHERKPWYYAEAGPLVPRAFGQYGELLEALRPRVRSGAVIALHEAGFVPFMLDVRNIDTLGLCSRFFGAMPTADAIFTDVGRYYPMTPRPPLHATEVYLLDRGVEWFIKRKSWMRTANGGHVPDDLLGGHFRLEAETSMFVIYRRTSRPPDPRWQSAHEWFENLAHPVNLEGAALNGTSVSPDEAPTSLPILHPGPPGEPLDVRLDPEWRLQLDLEHDHPVGQIYVEGAQPTRDIRIVMTLRTDAGAIVAEIADVVPAGVPIRLWHRLERGVHAGAADITMRAVSGTPVTVGLSALRLLGQSPALREHVVAHRGSDF